MYDFHSVAMTSTCSNGHTWERLIGYLKFWKIFFEVIWLADVPYTKYTIHKNDEMEEA